MTMMLFAAVPIRWRNGGRRKSEAAPETLKVGMLGLDIKTACIILAKELGHYEEEGVNVEFETISTWRMA